MSKGYNTVVHLLDKFKEMEQTIYDQNSKITKLTIDIDYLKRTFYTLGFPEIDNFFSHFHTIDSDEE